MAENPSGSHFDSIAEAYDETIPAHVMGHITERRIDLIRELAGDRAELLDVGCGTGVLAGQLVQAGFRVSGIDTSAGMLSLAEERGVTATVSSATELPFPDASFDLAYSMAVFHHICQPIAVRMTLAEMARVVKPGGAVLVWDHNPLNPYWPMFMKRLPQDTGEERLIPAAEIVDGMTAAGLHRISVKRRGWVPDFTPVGLLGAAKGLEKMLEASPGLRKIGASNVVIGFKDDVEG